MNKKCTNPSCRKTFSTLHFYGICPHCGKEYPQLISIRKAKMFPVVSPLAKERKAYWAVNILSYDFDKRVKILRIIIDFFQIRLKQAKEAMDHFPDTVFLLEQAEADQLIALLMDVGCTCFKRRSNCEVFSKGTLYRDKCSLVLPQGSKDFWTVRILDLNQNKVKTIKAIRTSFQIGLKEAKEAADHIPDTVFILDHDDVNQFIQALLEFGCTCQLKPAKSETVSKGILLPV